MGPDGPYLPDRLRPAETPPPVVRVLDLDDRATVAAWDRFVETTPEATFFHRTGWKRAIEGAFGHRCHFLYAEDARGIRGVLPLTHIRSPLFGNALLSNAFAVLGGPACRDGAARDALDTAALDLACRLGAGMLEYRLRGRERPDWPCEDTLYASFRRTLHEDPERNLKAIPRKQRAVVRKSLENGLTARADDDVDLLHRIYAESVRNLGTPVFPRRWFRALRDAFPGDCDVVSVHDGRQAVAAVLNFRFRDEVLPYYGGGTRAARTSGANDRMYWEVMARAAARGYRVFDFGRSKRGTGAFAFKKNWGFEPAPLAYEYRLFGRAERPQTNPTNPRYRLLVAAWRRLPLPLANTIGPWIARDLG
ncbi:FemAB family XrtA/PEP-CTERM system-associated protein [Rhodocista pekingensis]|uniref:FemAB family XrtA/PEP-CTERM system-associated protein n=1 Tax=Rhodocista pekingensis TaxID=201185 RepID=A0ABW2L2B7_9PROT